MNGLFVSSTGTSAGKTFVTRGLARALREQGQRVTAVKPIETGCTPTAVDALALARAAQDPSARELAALYRAQLPLAPYAVQLETGQPPPDTSRIIQSLHHLQPSFDWILVEGAGGLLVPLDRDTTMADFAKRLTYPVLLIAPDTLGVLSHVLAAFESARARDLALLGIVLTRTSPAAPDRSCETNASILRERTALPVLHFPYVQDDDAALGAAAVSCGLLRLLGRSV